MNPNSTNLVFETLWKKTMAQDDTIFMFVIFLVLFANIHPPKPIQVLPMLVANLEKSLLEWFMPYFLLLIWRNKVRNRMWGFEPWQKLHFDVIESDVWHCTSRMFDRKYFQSYKMTFLTFEYLLQKLTPFVYPSTTQFVKIPIPLIKVVKMVLYRLAHGISPKIMNALYDVGAL